MLVREDFDMICECGLTAQKDNHVLSCIKRTMGRRTREVILPLFSCLLGPHWILHPALRFQTQEGHGPSRASPEEGQEGDQRPGAPMKSRELLLFSLEKKRL